MLDPLIALAFAIYNSKGVYALLLGSGISRSTGIPTGWEVVLDLIRKVAHLQGADCEPDPAAWYAREFGSAPDYAQLLNQLAHTPTDRQRLLRGYFEPSDDERAEGLKVPTAAHHAIAELVASGFIRVIVTTNFDRLLETALEAAGIVPTVISTPDATEGALPLAHSPCTIVKIHGDYLDTRIKNTPEELAEYDQRLHALLDRIFDEYGLIVCGWSAEWDRALCASIERCSNHRFTMYWTVRGQLGEHAKQLCTLRRAQVLPIVGANEFFQALVEKVQALDEIQRPHPLSSKLAVVALKKYLVDPQHRIRLHDLVMGEVERAYAAIGDEQFPTEGEQPNATLLAERVQRYEALTETWIALMTHGCYWSTPEQVYLWCNALERLANPPGVVNGYTIWTDLKHYPALLGLYAGGIAALAAGQNALVAELFSKARAKIDGKLQPAALVLYPYKVMEHGGNLLPGKEQHPAPLSAHLFEVLREPLREYIPEDMTYERLFDRFEYLLAIVFVDLINKGKQVSDDEWGPLGLFGWRNRYGTQLRVTSLVANELAEQGADWPLLKVGLFDGSLERATAVVAAFNSFASRRHR